MKITLTTGEVVESSPRLSLFRNLKNAGIHITAPCGGVHGICGKCKVIVKEGDCRTQLQEKLSREEIDKGYAVSCQTFPESDMVIEIPPTSRLTVEGVIDTGKSRELEKLFDSFNAEISPLTTKVYLELPPPTVVDHIADSERLKRGLKENGFHRINIPFRMIRGLYRTLRRRNWKVTVTLVDMARGKEVIRVTPGGGEKLRCQYGLAIDIGTTTVVVYLVHLPTRKLVDIASTYNYQSIYGDDVLSRIVYASEQGGQTELQDAVIYDINNLLQPLLKKYKLTEDSIDSIVVAANTAMVHLLFGLDPSSIRKEPYIPTANFFPSVAAGRLGINVTPDAPVYALPCVASYVGGDIIAGVLAARIYEKEEISILIDIGTNGELVIGNREWMMTAACSAGPCFEGGGLKHGMRATRGAIDAVNINPETLEPEINVIGEGPPEGVCGSGIIDALAEFFMKGIITSNGKFKTGQGIKNISLTDEGPVYILFQDREKEVCITEADIDNIIRAKAAIYAGFTLLLKEVGLCFDDIATIYIAGGFGRYLNIQKAVTIGMLPDQPEEKFKYLGNTAVTGSYLCLLSDKLRKDAEKIADKMTYVELSVSGHYMDEYVAGLFLPHTDLGAFPRVASLLSPGSPSQNED